MYFSRPLRFQDGSGRVVPTNLWDDSEGDTTCWDEHCGMIQYDGKLHETQCDNAFPYICQL